MPIRFTRQVFGEVSSPQPKTERHVLCRCALSSKGLADQLGASWDAVTRMKDADLALQFLAGALSNTSKVEGDCLVGLEKLKQHIEMSEEAVKRQDFDKASGLIQGARDRYSTLLINCLDTTGQSSFSEISDPEDSDKKYRPRVLKSFEATDTHGFRVRVNLTSRTLLLGKDEEYLTLCNVDVTMSFAEVEECWRTSRNARDLYVKAKELYAGLGFTVEEVEG